jgi:hypothetical protein
MRWVNHVAHVGEMRKSYNILAGKPKWKRPCRRLRCRWEDNSRLDLQEIGWEVVDWIHLAQLRD